MRRRGRPLRTQAASADVRHIDPGHDDSGRARPDLRIAAVPATATCLPRLRQVLAEWAARTPLLPDQVHALHLAGYEALANVVEHAYHRDRTGIMHVDAVHDPGFGTVTVTVTDHGRWQPVAVDPRSTRGFGIPLIRALADRVEIIARPGGTTVRMTWTLRRHPTTVRCRGRRAC